ncbi:MAG: anthranilate synthase component I, partial [Aquificaceae bacterium]|nr:anthranilate synthase component I [Aquificaceae bacterium]
MFLSFTFEEIEELLREYDPVPLFAEFVADTDTPLSLYLKLREGWKHSFLLESAEGGAKWGRYSFIVLSSGSYYAFKEGTGYLYREGRVRLFREKDPLRPVEELLRSFRPYKDRRLPRFWGGLVGYVGYEVVSSYEPVGRPDRDALELFDLFMVMSQVVVVHDNLSGSIKVIVPLRREGGALQEYQRARETIQEVKRRIFKTAVQPVHLSTCEPELQEWHSNFTQEGFMEAVSRAKNYIAQG